MEVLMKYYISKFNKRLRYIYLLAAVAFVTYGIYTHITVEKKNLKYKFNGVIEKVSYDDKGDPSITIKGKIYDLTSNSWNFNHLICKGDSLKKDSGKLAIKLVKHKNGKVIIFDWSNTTLNKNSFRL
jgi:hypothetical protein